MTDRLARAAAGATKPILRGLLDETKGARRWWQATPKLIVSAVSLPGLLRSGRPVPDYVLDVDRLLNEAEF